MNPQNPKDSQLPLDLPVDQRVTRDDLLQSNANRLAVDLLDSWPDWPSNMVLLAGPTGSGKSHIARVWADHANAEFISPESLVDFDKRDNVAGVLEGGVNNFVLEDLGAGELNEQGLFHLINRIRAYDGFLLMTSRSFPPAWQLQLPDLVSRIRLAHIVELQEPDDALLTAIIVKLFADRQVEISPAIVDYLVARMERSLGAAGKLVEWMDRQAMSRKSRINRQLASEALQVHHMQ